MSYSQQNTDLIEKARQASLADFFTQNGFETERIRFELHVKGYGGLYVNIETNEWYCFSQAEKHGGRNAINCLTDIIGMDFKSAVEALSGANMSYMDYRKISPKLPQKKELVLPERAATISSAQFGILLALLFMPASTLWSRAIFAFATAILGTWIFVWFIQRIQFKDVVMVPLVGIMFGNVIGGITNYLAYKYEMTQALSSWLVGHFSLVLKGRYEIVWLTVPLVVLAFLFANHFNIVGLGKDFSKNLGVPYNLVLFSGLTIAAMITASIVVVVGSISYIGLIVPNVVAMYKGDKIRGTLVDTALFGAIFVLVCDMIGRIVIAPYELPIELIVGILGSLIFIALLFYRLKHGRKAIRLGGAGTSCCSTMPNLKGGADQ